MNGSGAARPGGSRLVRPYVGIPRHPRDESAQVPRAVRPYSITGGRTRPCRAGFGVETVLLTTPTARARGAEGGVERRAIVEMCEAPQSVAEVAAALDVPVGVAAVLAADMVADGLLETRSSPERCDAALVQRLIEGVRAL